MTKQVLSIKDFNGNEVLNFRIENVGALLPGSHGLGRIVFLTTDKQYYKWDGATWGGIGGGITDIIANLPLSVSIDPGGVATLSVADATTTAKGVQENATLAEVIAKSLSNRTVTPSSLTDFSLASSFQFTGNGVLTSFSIIHGLGTRNLMIQVWDNAAPYCTAIVDVDRTTVNSLTIRFEVPPAGGVAFDGLIIRK